ncbi:MAG: porin [Rikenellaceae bacterium]|nr:porin [Rikenellaceae bacterium]
MKRLRLISLLFAFTVAGTLPTKAQTTVVESDEYTPSVFIIARDGGHKHNHETLRLRVVDDYRETTRKGFRQSHKPHYIFASPDNKFSFALGGSVTLRTSYDFDGVMGNIDFVPFDIPAKKGFANRQRIMMDASTSRFFMQAIIHSGCLGRIKIYSDIDFRGGEAFSYIPRLRSAYIQFCGFTVGRDVSTFCDLGAAPRTIDFEGPNAYNFEFTEMIRYEYSFLRNHMKVGIAAEVPKVNGTYGEHFAPIYQRVPDGIAYIQYAWGEHQSSHLRVSGVIRDMYLHNVSAKKNTTEVGWGVQLSGHISASRWVDIFMNGVYGKGITPYIQDLTGEPYDVAYNPENPMHIQTMPMWGWQAAAQINIMPGRFWVAGGYSEVCLEKENGYLAKNEYHKGQYIFGNAFFNMNRDFTLALEYLYGSRKNMDNEKASANRLSLMLQYNF